MEIIGFEHDICVIDDFFEDIDQINNLLPTETGKYTITDGDCIKRYTFFLDGQESDDQHILCANYLTNLRETMVDIYGVELNHKSHVPFMVYEKGCSMYYHDDLYHNADSGERIKSHIYSSVHFINDEYEGGELDFRDFGLSITKRKNRLILFRSEYMHSSLVITEGTKISSTHFWSKDESDQKNGK